MRSGHHRHSCPEPQPPRSQALLARPSRSPLPYRPRTAPAVLSRCGRRFVVRSGWAEGQWSDFVRGVGSAGGATPPADRVLSSSPERTTDRRRRQSRRHRRGRPRSRRMWIRGEDRTMPRCLRRRWRVSRGPVRRVARPDCRAGWAISALSSFAHSTAWVEQ